eukprot:Clim_evm38s246 gene=Clim_evmTU38s246
MVAVVNQEQGAVSAGAMPPRLQKMTAELREEFRALGAENISDDALAVAVSIAENFYIGVADLVTKWEAYAYNANIKPTVEGFEALRTHLYDSHKRSMSKGIGGSASTPMSAKSMGSVYNKASLSGKLSGMGVTHNLHTPTQGSSSTPMADRTKSVLNAADVRYNTSPTTPSSLQKRPAEGSTSASKRGTSTQGTPTSAARTSVVLGQATPSPALQALTGMSLGDTPYMKMRTQSGKVLMNHKIGSGIAEDVQSRTSRPPVDFTVHNSRTNLTEDYRYGWNRMDEICEDLDWRINEMGIQMQGTTNPPIEEYLPVNAVNHSMGWYCGRIWCDGEGRLNEVSALLEGNIASSGGARVTLDLHDVPSFSIFPGQVIAVEGMNPTGGCIHAKQILPGCIPSLPKTPSHRVKAFYYGDGVNTKAEPAGPYRPMEIAAISGPFCLANELEFTPWKEFLNSFDDDERTVPSVLVVLGPILHESHPLLASCRDHTVADLVAEHFSGPLVQALQRHEDLQVVLVPSAQDINNEPICPTPMYNALDLAMEHERVHCIANPFTFCLNEVVVGVATFDVVKHLSGEEISRQAKGGAVKSNRMQRLTSHLLHQRSYYPLFPTHLEVNVDMKQASKMEVPAMPDVLILPSDLVYFAHTTEATTVLNPGRFVKGNSAGSYARIRIAIPDESTFDTVDSDQLMAHCISSRCEVEIVRP